MKLFVNEKELTLFEGATVTDALRMYSSNAINDVNNSIAEVLDKYGNVVGLGGELTEGARLFFRTLKVK